MPTAKRLLNIGMQNKGSLSNTDDGKCICQNKAYNTHVEGCWCVSIFLSHYMASHP